MWRVVFFVREGKRVRQDKSGPWLPDRNQALRWAQWFAEQGYVVSLEDQFGMVQRLPIPAMA
ncbi:hypothetical protein ACG0Z6_05710 [Roseateles sp. BYS180W]|uniref:Transposase n=1 Tax=Roseateles rivi TaxID=3299028 RepID=A0ABW7FTU3_9BURK